MDWNKTRRALARALTPGGVDEIRAINGYCRRHGITGDLRGKRRAFVLGRQYGLTLLPDVDLAGGLVVDVGANVGGFVEAVLRASPSSTVIAIEPGAVRNQLQTRFADDRRVTIDGRAMSAEAGTATFHETNESVFSSLRAPDESLAETYGSMAIVTGSSVVETATLDEVVAGRKVSLLKIDVQGAEGDLIRGAPEALTNTEVVLLEVNFLTHYKGEANFAELHQMMAAHGLVLWQLGEPYRPNPNGRALWADACYVRAESVYPD